MKKVIGILALLALTGNIASAELLKNFKWNGSMEVKTAAGTDSVDAAKSDWSNINSRLMLGIGFDLNEDVAAHVTAVKSDYRMYGTAAQKADGVAGNSILENITFEEAYISAKNVLWINHKIGRQFYGKAGDMVIYYGPSFGVAGAAGVANFTVSALDGWYGEWMKGKWTVAGLAAKLAENSNNAPRDITLHGATVKYDHSEEVKANAYFYQQDDRNDAVAPVSEHNTLNVAGVKAEGKFEGIGYGVEYAMNMGKNKQLGTDQDYTGTAMKVNLDYGFDLNKFGKFEVMGEYASGSGDETSADEYEGFKAISSNYLPGIIFSQYGVGQPTMNGVENLTVMNAGLKYMPKQIEKLSIGAKYFIFNPTEEPVGYDTYGSELDLCLGWKHSENVGLKASYAMFMPDDDFATTTGGSDKTETLYGLDLVVKF